MSAFTGNSGFISFLRAIRYALVGSSNFNANPAVSDAPHIFELVNDNRSDQCLRMSAYGVSTNGNNFHPCRYNGTLAAPTALTSGQDIFSFGARGANDSSGVTSQSMAAIQVLTNQNWSPAAMGTEILLSVTKLNQTSRLPGLMLDGVGVQIGDQQNGTTGRVLASNPNNDGTLQFQGSPDQLGASLTLGGSSHVSLAKEALFRADKFVVQTTAAAPSFSADVNGNLTINGNNLVMGSGSTSTCGVLNTVQNGLVQLCGDTGFGVGGNFTGYGSLHATKPSWSEIRGARISFKDTAGVEHAAFDSSGNLQIGGTSGSASLNATGSGSQLVAQFITSGGSAMWYTGAANLTMSAGENAANSAVKIRKDSTTSRSVSAAGTLNASGADYAEYHVKAAGAGTIAKGDVCGFDAQGQLVTRYDLAVGFGIKSTAPNLVGGDSWGHADALGQEEPKEPVYVHPVYEGPEPPAPLPQIDLESLPADPEHPGPAADYSQHQAPKKKLLESVGAYVSRVARHHAEIERLRAHHQQRLETYEATAKAIADLKARVREHIEKATAQHHAQKALFEPAWAAYQDKVKAAQQAHQLSLQEYEQAKARFVEAHEAARQQVDRIAYCGIVPVNVEGAQVGDYLVPVPTPSGGISARAVRAAEATLRDLQAHIGVVRFVGADGRPQVSVNPCSVKV